jgi:hypothetical protein
VWIGSIGAGAGATNNTVKNCVIQNGTVGATAVTNFGIFVGDTTGAANGNDNDNLTIQNNLIIKTTIGIQAIGAAAGLNDNPTIVDNTIGDPTVTANFIGRFGMNVGQSTGAVISRNTIQNVVTSDPAVTSSNNATGIILSAGLVNSTISRNNVTGIRYTSTAGYGGKGIDVNTGSATSNLTIANNFISDIKGDGWNTFTSDSIVGLRIASTGNVKVYNNSVNLGSGAFAGASPTGGTTSAAFFAASTSTALDVRNNIFAINLDNTNNTTDKSYAIATDATTNALFATINKNDYFPSGPAGKVGVLNAVDRNDLAAWKTASGQDGLSKQVDPKFTSAINLHLNVTAGPSPVENSGDSIVAVADDFDGNARGPVPELGADELDSCAGVVCTGFDTPCGTASCDPNGVSGNCQILTPVAAGPVCRAANGICDVAESCDGVNVFCPADGYVNSGVECRGSAGTCDVAEACTGSSPACPADGVVGSGTECRASAGGCDVAETCDGVSGACPADAVQSSGFECRASAGDCDVAETCDGSSTACPADGFISSSFECRPSAGGCDIAETCTGSSATCPADAVQGSGYECRGSAGACDVAETCDGSSTACPADGVQTAGFECRASAGGCDIAETCDGSSTACPADVLQSSGYECRAAAGSCDIAETCDGSTAACPAGRHRCLRRRMPCFGRHLRRRRKLRRIVHRVSCRYLPALERRVPRLGG